MSSIYYRVRGNRSSGRASSNRGWLQLEHGAGLSQIAIWFRCAVRTRHLRHSLGRQIGPEENLALARDTSVWDVLSGGKRVRIGLLPLSNRQRLTTRSLQAQRRLSPPWRDALLDLRWLKIHAPECTRNGICQTSEITTSCGLEGGCTCTVVFGKQSSSSLLQVHV